MHGSMNIKLVAICTVYRSRDDPRSGGGIGVSGAVRGTAGLLLVGETECSMTKRLKTLRILCSV